MVNSLSCVVSGDVDPENYGDLFGTVCGLSDGACDGIAANASTGNYGAYSMCNATQQLSFVLNQYYLSQNSDESSCNFDGSASLKDSVEPSGGCANLVKQAGDAGTGTVTSQPSGTGAGAAGSGGSGGGSSTSSGAAAPGVSIEAVHFGFMGTALVASVALFSGAAMVLL